MTWGFVTCGPNEALVVSGKNGPYININNPRTSLVNVMPTGVEIELNRLNTTLQVSRSKKIHYRTQDIQC